MVRRLLFTALFAAKLAFANYFGTPTMAGNPQSLLSLGSPASGTPTISPSQFRPGQGPGKLVGNVNVFTGQPAYSIPLGGLSARGAVSFPISLNFGGPLRPLVEGDRAIGAVGWIGLGWSFSTPYIAVNHKGTLTSSDDVLMADFGPFGGGQLLQSPPPYSAIHLATNPYLNVTPTIGTGEFANQIVSWTIKFPDGKRLNFGSSDNARRMVFYNGNIIRATPFPGVASKRFIYRWDISSLSDFSGVNTILFDYEKFTEGAEQGRVYDRESYVKNIRWDGPDGQEAERYEFHTNQKSASEYFGYSAGESKDNQKTFEKRYLDAIACYKEGVLSDGYVLIHEEAPGTGGFSTKRLLKEVKVYRYDHGQNPQEDRGWSLAYSPGSTFYQLLTVTRPDGGKVDFSYREVNFTGKDGDQTSVDDFMKEDDHITYVSLPTDNAKLLKWRNETKCDDRFCYIIIKDGDDIPDAQGRSEKVYVEIRPNLGNYFDTASSTAVKRFESASTTTPAADLDLIPAGDHFLWVDYKYGTVDLWEWDNGIMVRRFPFSGDGRYVTGNLQHRIKVYTGGDYFVVHKTDTRTSGTGSATPNEIIVVKRLPGGQWTSLNRSPFCSFDNKDDYSQIIRVNPASGACVEYLPSDLIVSTAPSYFIVVHKETDVLNLFGMKSDGTGFLNQSNQIPVARGQVLGYPVNWNTNLEGVTSTNDYFVISHRWLTAEFVDVFYYGGDHVFWAGSSDVLHWDGRTIWPSEDYFIEKNNTTNEFYFWKKQVLGGGTVAFTRNLSPITTLEPSNLGPNTFSLVRTIPKAFTVEYYDHQDSVGCRPSAAGDQWAVNLYRVDKGFGDGYLREPLEMA